MSWVVGKNKIILAKFMKKISIVWKHNILTTIKSRLIVYNDKQTKRKIANKRVGQKEKKLYSLSFANVFSLTDLSKIVRDRSLITSPGGNGGGFGGGYNFKTSPFFGGKFFTGKKHEGGQILWHSNSSVGNLTSVIYPRSHLQVYQISKSKDDNNFIHGHKQLNFNILNNVK